MIRGEYSETRGPAIPLLIRGPDGSNFDVIAVVDTGFTAALTLPEPIIRALSLPFDSTGRLSLADGTVSSFDLHSAEIFWDGQWRPVLASAIGDEVLVGMRLLRGFRLCIDAIPSGAVEITSLLLP